MIYLTSAEHQELLRARDERDQLRRVLAAAAGEPRVLAAGELHLLADSLVNSAGISGLVLTIEQQPALPLAMGNYTTVISVRPARVPAMPRGADVA